MGRNAYTNPAACLAAILMTASAGFCQDVKQLTVNLFPEADAVRCEFPTAQPGYTLVIAGPTNEVGKVLTNLPPILVNFTATDFFVMGDATVYRLRRWIQTYYAQFVHLSGDSLELGNVSASTVLSIQPGDAPPPPDGPDKNDIPQRPDSDGSAAAKERELQEGDAAGIGQDSGKS